MGRPLPESAVPSKEIRMRTVMSAALFTLAASTAALAQAPARPAAHPPAKAAAAPAANRGAIAKVLVANENKVNDAIAKHDVKAFTELVAADALAADASGFMRTADFAKTLDQMKVVSWHIMDERVVWIDDTSAIVA